MRRTLRDDDGVSAVVGTLLVLAVGVSVFATIALEWAPVWQANAEAAESVGVDAQLSALNAQIRTQTLTPSTGALGATVTLGQARTSLLASASLPGALEFTPGTTPVSIRAPTATVLHANGTSLSVAGNEWKPFPGFVTLEDVGEIESFRLRVREVSSAMNARAVTVTVTDAGGAFAGSYRLNITHQAPNIVLSHGVRNSANEFVNVVPYGFHDSAFLKPYHVNLLSPDFAFDQILAAAAGPVKIAIAYDPGFDTDYSIAYRETDPSGARILVGTGGQTRSPLRTDFDGGSLSVELRNSELPVQKYTLENGALILEQPGGAVFRVEPAIDAFRMGNKTALTIDVSSLRGSLKSLTGNQVVTVVTTPAMGESYVGTAPRMNATITTEYPALWASFLDNKLRQADLSSSGLNPEFRLTTTGSTVFLEVFGRTPEATSTIHDVFFTVSSARIAVNVET